MMCTVVGLGKIGLPLAVQFASKGASVFGCDINAKTVELVNAGLEPFPGEQFLGVRLNEVLKDEGIVHLQGMKYQLIPYEANERRKKIRR